MKRILLLAAACLICAPLPAAEPSADDYLNFLKPIVGDWTIQGKMDDKTATGTLSIRLSPSGCLVCEGSPLFQFPAYHSIDGYDPGTKRWTSIQFNTAGERWVVYMSSDVSSLKSNRATFKYETTIAKPDGKKDVWRGEFTIATSPDRWTQAYTNSTLNGKAQPDEEYVYEQKGKPVGAAQGVTADDYIEYHRPMLGSWKATAEEAGKTFPGTIEWRLGAGGKSLLISIDLKGLPEAQFMHGYDPVSRKFMGSSVDAEGTYQAIALDITGMAKGKKLAVGPIGTWEETRRYADGKTVKATETVSCTEMGKDRIVFVWSNRKEGGKTLPDWRLTYERPHATSPRKVTDIESRHSLPIPDNALEALSFFVGNWESETFENGVKIGADEDQRKWGREKSCVTMESSGPEQGTQVYFSGISGWDAKSEQLVEHWHGTNGLYAEIRYPLRGMKGDLWEGTHTAAFADGKEASGHCQLKKTAEGFVWTARWKQDGKDFERKSVTRRVKPKAATAPGVGPNAAAPALLKEYGRLTVGQWECKASVPWGAAPGAGTVPLRATCSWILGGAALEWEFQVGNEKSQGFTYWDPTSRQLKGLVVGSTGDYIEIITTKEAGKWVMKGAMTKGDGKRSEIHMATTFDPSGETHVNEYPTHKDVFHRIKKQGNTK